MSKKQNREDPLKNKKTEPNYHHKLSPEQYQAFAEMIAQNAEDNKKLNKEIQLSLSKEFNIHMGYIKTSIDTMDGTIKDHNGRLREVEESNIKIKEREIYLNERVDKFTEKLRNQKTECAAHKLSITKLEKLESILQWIHDHPKKTILIAFTVIIIIDLIYHIFGWAGQEFGDLVHNLIQMIKMN